MMRSWNSRIFAKVKKKMKERIDHEMIEWFFETGSFVNNPWNVYALELLAFIVRDMRA